ncbi:MAG: ACP phosphodiesterase [Bacteroidota bacterium]
MNFLAHLVLSCHDPELQMGNLLGDFTKGRPPSHYPAGIKSGIALHRLIDQTTDSHPAVLEILPFLRPRHGRYAGVVTDVLFDYYLFRDWQNFVPISYADFSHQAYANIRRHLPLLRPKLADRFRQMVEEQWLGVYSTVPGILQVFERMRSRVSQPDKLDALELTIAELDDQLELAFRRLFPDLRNLVNEFCGCA